MKKIEKITWIKEEPSAIARLCNDDPNFKHNLAIMLDNLQEKINFIANKIDSLIEQTPYYQERKAFELKQQIANLTKELEDLK